MSSVPVLFLISVLPIPVCSTPPTIVPVSDCSEAQIAFSTTFQLEVSKNCDPSDATIADLITSASTNIEGVQSSNLTQANHFTSATKNFTWTPTNNHNGSQLFCVTAFTRFLFSSLLSLIVNDESFLLVKEFSRRNSVCRSTFLPIPRVQQRHPAHQHQHRHRHQLLRLVPPVRVHQRRQPLPGARPAHRSPRLFLFHHSHIHL